jgi:hypothetical protein
MIFRGLFFEHNTEIGQKDLYGWALEKGVVNHCHNPLQFRG